MKQLLLLFCFIPLFLSAQIVGIVRDENNEPIAFASVYIRGTTNGTVSNASGEFRLTVKPGSYDVVFQYIGYKQKIVPIVVGEKTPRMNVQMESSDLQFNEVVITTDDPAVRMMREVIAKRSYYKKRVEAYSCDAYVKGFYKLKDAPKKIFGQDVGNMGGILDTNRAGVIYLSESVSKIYVQSQPARKKEVMISSKVSGSENGFSLNRATLTDFNLYDEHLEIEREVLSPLADNAFSYYDFRFKGRYKDQNGYDICKIQVNPKRPADPTFSGYLYVVDEWWNLAGADLFLTGASIKQPVLDTMRIQQEFVPVEKPDTWCILTQVTSFKFKVFGFLFDGFFNSVFTDYNLKPNFDKDFFDRETFKIEKTANVRDSTYWAAIRPVPLTTEEARDYVKKDSLQTIWKSKEYLDSIDHKGNRFKPMDLLMGYTWNNSYKNRSFDYPAAFRWVQFNSVQGWVLNFQPKFRIDSDARGTRFWRGEGALNYGFSENKLRGSLKLQRRLESIRYATAEVSGGIMPEQFNGRNPIGQLTNSQSTLFFGQNYIKLYEKTWLRGEWSQMAGNSILLRGAVEYARRARLVNTTSYTWYRGDDRPFTDNLPGPTPTDVRQLDFGKSFLVDLNARIRFGQTYSTYPNFRIYEGSKWPEINLRVRTALPGVLGSDADYGLAQVQLRQDNVSWGLAGYSEWNVSGGYFFNRNTVKLMDYYTPNGNQTLFGKPAEYGRSFLLMPYYAFATKTSFVEAHWQHHLQGWLLDKIPVVRKLNWKEVLGASLYYSDEVLTQAPYPTQVPYWEANFGFENIGYGVFRALRIDVAAGFVGNKYYTTRLVLGIDL